MQSASMVTGGVGAGSFSGPSITSNITSSLPPGLKRAPVTPRAGGKQTATSPAALEALRSLFKTFPEEGDDPAQRKEWLKALGNRKRYADHQYSKLDEVNSLHKAIANSFNEDEGAGGYSERDVCKKLEGGSDFSSKLHHLLAQGSYQRTILHIMLDPNTYSEHHFGLRFGRLKPLIKFLLWLQPALPKVAANGDATPLFFLVKSQAEKSDDDYDTRSATGSNYDETEGPFLDEKAKAEILQFLCEAPPMGLGSKEAIESLGMPESSSSDDSSRGRNAIHAAIEGDFAISEDIVAKLSKISVPFKADSTGREEKTPCLEIPDRLGRSCLHIALTASFSETKISWAKQLAKHQPSLLKAKYKYKDKTGSELEMTPLQHFTRERENNETAGHKDKTSTKARGAVNIPKELDIMEEVLKCQCLEAFDNDTCKSIMYTRENAKEIFLTLDDETICSELLENQSSHYRLDTSLKAVHILSNNRIEWDEKRKDDKELLNIVNSWRCPGNKDLYMVFHWLKEPKRDPQGAKKDRPGTKKVFEVMVEELPSSGNLPHSDKAITECLRDLNVETWDWKRMDIPVDVIEEAAGNSVKALNLYCSGLKAVLRGWSDTKGLVNLKNLERVEVELHQGLESKESMKNSAEEFKADLESLHAAKYKDKIEKKEKKKLEVICTPIFTQSKQSFLNEEAASKMKTDGEPGFEEQDWLKCMDEFADLMEYIESNQMGSRNTNVRPIKIALIDDGVKTSYASLNENIQSGKSGWSTATATPKGSSKKKSTKSPLRNYNWSHTGHGTVMAYYIRRVCPKVKLCVAKLDPQPRPRSNTGGGNSDQITFSIESVIDAVKWAVTEEVDIISMSWAIDPLEDPLEDQERQRLLQSAINLAAKNSILLFCANPDKGPDYQENVTYPKAAVPDKTLFVVGAAKDDGKRWKKISESDDSCDFFLPGVDLGIQVESMNRKKSLENPPPMWHKHSGSSLSCALASGLAAMILHCTLVSGKVVPDVRNDSKWAWLKTRNGMSEALRSINVDRRDSGKGQWLGVRRLFGEAVKSLDGPSSEAAKALQEKVVAKLLAASPSGSRRSDPAPGALRRAPTSTNMG